MFREYVTYTRYVFIRVEQHARNVSFLKLHTVYYVINTQNKKKYKHNVCLISAIVYIARGDTLRIYCHMPGIIYPM